MGYSWGKGWPQYAYTQMQALFGTALDPDKSQRMSGSPTYIGVCFDLHRVLSHGMCGIAPKPGRLEDIDEIIVQAEADDELRKNRAS